MDDIIAKWNKTHNLIDLIIRDLEKYLKNFQNFYDSNKFPANQKANYQNYVVIISKKNINLDIFF